MSVPTRSGTGDAYDVGGTRLHRPYRLRRLGHFGLSSSRIEESVLFYRDLLGFALSDELDLSPRVSDAALLARAGDPRAYFMRYGTDHHSLLLLPRRITDLIPTMAESRLEMTVNQITWQVASLREVVEAHAWLTACGIPVKRAGRDTPGSNWHVYMCDPDGFVHELYYGIEQIGWDGRSKPHSMYVRGFRDVPALPQIGELDEVQQALEQGQDLGSGYRHTDSFPRIHDVDGVLLGRPFKVVRIGPVRVFVDDLDRSQAFVEEQLGLTHTATIAWQGQTCLYYRCGTEHHSLALIPLALRDKLGLSPHSRLMSFGLQLGSYRQLRDALTFLTGRGVHIKQLPPELSPGIDYAAFAIDPDGHAIQLYHAMQQVNTSNSGTDSDPTVHWTQWPEMIDPRPDTFGDEPFFGPWG